MTKPKVSRARNKNSARGSLRVIVRGFPFPLLDHAMGETIL
jgi:hypothetical protein